MAVSSTTASAASESIEKKVDPRKLASRINGLIDQFHVNAVSEDPFEWQPTSAYAKGKEILAEVADLLRGYQHVSKKGVVTKILLFGVGLPLLLALGAWQLQIPSGEDARVIVYISLGVVALGVIIAAAVIGTPEEIDLDFGLAWYTISRGWAFSRCNQSAAWELYCKRFGYFNCGDEDQGIPLRIWGTTEDGRPFQLFEFYYETVYYTTEYTHDEKGNITGSYQVKHEDPHYRYGIFLKVPESKVRFRISEIGGDFGKRVELESAAFNDAVGVYCDEADEAEVVKFLSPAVIVAMEEFFTNLDGVVLDFYPGMLLVGTEHDFLGDGSVTLNENAPRFEEEANRFGEGIEKFRAYIDGAVNAFRKYND
ncbi:MAG: hypothetical protein A3J67_00290 [Parcubacteria group bacterium RIFCSPHIGHO2_02_FULL_48_10b]|nr:MAG: hypothetical protein A3J67_00290 [Parcubacteria group bacterium RIFCSPHIGHO2_02_FULL_48_10b]